MVGIATPVITKTGAKSQEFCASYSHACVLAAGRGRLLAGRWWFWAGGCNLVQSAPMNCNLLAAVINQNLESFMDNITPLVHGTKSTCNITLDEYQNAFYQQSCINILSPDGNLLQHIGYEVEKDAKHQLQDEIHLVSCLLHNIHHDLDLPQHALYGLADLMYRVQEFCDKNKD